MGRILITGGCGFLGHYLINEIKKNLQYLKIKIVDLKESPFDDYKVKDKNIELSLGKDITNFDSIQNEFNGFDIVIHCAGLVSFSLKDKKNLFMVNVKGTKNVLKAALQNKVKYFVHISSVAALGYKNFECDLVDENFTFNWGVAKTKNKFYMFTKYLADIEVNKYKDKMNTLILYPGLMFGPGDFKNSVKLIQSIKERKIPFNMPGGTNVIDVRDVARGIILAIKKKTTGNFLLSGYNMPFAELNQKIANVVGEKAPSKTVPKWLSTLFYFVLLNLERIMPDIKLTADNIDSAFKYRYFSNLKAKKEFNWKPKIEFKQTIQDTYNWMLRYGIVKK